jgi:hypothetical protein
LLIDQIAVRPEANQPVTMTDEHRAVSRNVSEW